ncbi:MAG: YraN family protein [Syntrophobacteraceae bacterium]|nr:YraN family protein [Desulfobacteraceae bacterium]
MPGVLQRKGREGEEIAADFLSRRGMAVLDRNFRCPLGEIDLVCKDGGRIVFVEVKSRRSRTCGLPQEAVSPAKQRRLTLVAQWYLKRKGLDRGPARFDVVAVSWRGSEPEITWIANAFEARE